jgi:RHS repeat-associated protein
MICRGICGVRAGRRRGMTGRGVWWRRCSSGTGAVTTSYVYDAEGRRVKKTNPTIGTVVYVYDAFGQLAAEHGAGSTAGCDTCYLLTDHLGTTRAVGDKNGVVVKRRDHMPFGEEVVAPWLNGRGAVYGAATTVKPGFTGWMGNDASEWDVDYAVARYFRRGVGRFVSADLPVIDQDTADPQSWNLYTYVRNNPLKFIDPTGRTISFANEDDEEQFKKYEAALAKDTKKYSSQIATVDQLRKSKVNYQFHVGGKQQSATAEGNVGFDGTNVTVNIRNVGGPSGEKFSLTGRIAHELEHARQVDSGELTFLQDGKGNYSPSPITYDAMDEVRAFHAQLGLTMPIESSKSPTLSNLGMARTDREAANAIIQAYPRLKNRPLNSVYRLPASSGAQAGDIIRRGGFGRVHSVIP